jgi:hypothetical protein
MLAYILIDFAVWANLSVDKDSYRNYGKEAIVEIMIVLEFSDNEGFKIFVRTEFLNGTKMFFFAVFDALAL